MFNSLGGYDSSGAQVREAYRSLDDLHRLSVPCPTLALPLTILAVFTSLGALRLLLMVRSFVEGANAMGDKVSACSCQLGLLLYSLMT